MVQTRRSSRGKAGGAEGGAAGSKASRVALNTLASDPNVLAHVLSSLSLHHGIAAVEDVASVCNSWRVSVEGRLQIRLLPENLVGELRSGEKPYRFDRPHDACFLPNGDVCVADCDNFRLHIVEREGAYVREIKLGGGTSCPTGVTCVADHLFVVEHGAHRVSKLRRTSGGHRQHTSGSWGSGPGELRHPWGVAALGAHDGVILVTDSGNDRVCAFGGGTLDYRFSFGTTGSGLGELRDPRGIAVHGEQIWVVDSGNHRVQLFSAGEALMAALKRPSAASAGGATAGGGAEQITPTRCIGGGRSSLAGRFDTPTGIAFANGNLAVTEQGNERVQVLSLSGLPLQSLPFEGPVSGICADKDMIAVTALEGTFALTLWNMEEKVGHFLQKRERGAGSSTSPSSPDLVARFCPTPQGSGSAADPVVLE